MNSPLLDEYPLVTATAGPGGAGWHTNGTELVARRGPQTVPATLVEQLADGAGGGSGRGRGIFGCYATAAAAEHFVAAAAAEALLRRGEAMDCLMLVGDISRRVATQRAYRCPACMRCRRLA